MELWDIYDKNKNLTGRTMVRNDWSLKDDEYHLTVLGIIRNKEDKYLITQRVMTKAWAAGWWEVSGGGVQAGESSREAVNREVLEETGLDVAGLEPICMLTYARENPGEGDNYFVDYYLFELDFSEKDVKLQTEEAMGFKLAKLEEIKELAKQGIFLHFDSIKEIFSK